MTAPHLIPAQDFTGVPKRLCLTDSGQVDTDGVTLYNLGTAATSTPAASEVHLGEVGGRTAQIRATFNRPADANDYAANDAVCNSTSAPTPITFTGAARIIGGSGYVTELEVIHEKVSLTPRFRLHLFNALPTGFNDNAALALTYAVTSAASYLGYIDTPAATSNAGTDYSIGQNITDRKPFKCAADANLYGLLQTLDIIVAPGNAKGVTVKILVEQN